MRQPEPEPVDVLVVGAGPAGGAAALVLAQQGVRVRVLERDALPRSKPCGGLLPAAALDALPANLAPPVLNRLGAFRFQMGADRSFERTLPERAMLLVDRPEFDQFLVTEAERLGGGSVELRQESPAVDIEEDTDQVRIRTGDGLWHVSRTVIAADGARGAIRRLLGGRRPVHGVAMEWNIEAGRRTDELGDVLAFDFGAAEAGYGWSFPRTPDSLNIGVIDWSASGELPARLREFTSSLLDHGVGEGAKPSGFPIPYFDGDYRQATNRICFVGDAAGLVDGVSGEGIRFALASGVLAARYALERLQPGGEDALSEGYLHALRQRCGGSWKMEQVRRFVRLPFLQRREYFFDRVLKPAEFPFYWS